MLFGILRPPRIVQHFKKCLIVVIFFKSVNIILLWELFLFCFFLYTCLECTHKWGKGQSESIFQADWVRNLRQLDPTTQEIVI